MQYVEAGWITLFWCGSVREGAATLLAIGFFQCIAVNKLVYSRSSLKRFGPISLFSHVQHHANLKPGSVSTSLRGYTQSSKTTPDRHDRDRFHAAFPIDRKMLNQVLPQDRMLVAT